MFQVSQMILRNFMYNYMYIEKMVIIHSWYIYIYFFHQRAYGGGVQHKRTTVLMWLWRPRTATSSVCARNSTAFILVTSRTPIIQVSYFPCLEPFEIICMWFVWWSLETCILRVSKNLKKITFSTKFSKKNHQLKKKTIYICITFTWAYETGK